MALKGLLLGGLRMKAWCWEGVKKVLGMWHNEMVGSTEYTAKQSNFALRLEIYETGKRGGGKIYEERKQENMKKRG